MSTLENLQNTVSHCSMTEILKQGLHSKSQVYEWKKEGVRGRKEREPKGVNTQTFIEAIKVVQSFPHLSAVKGQMYMVYHRLGFIPQHIYKEIKTIVKHLIFQDISSSGLLPDRTNYTHEIPNHVSEIWAEDLTQIKVFRHTFYISLIIDTFSCYYLSAKSNYLPNKYLIAVSVDQAVKQNNGEGPTKFLQSDNGKQYMDDNHQKQLDTLNIIQKRIPACKPQYNGSIECGVKEFKQTFYTQWANYVSTVEIPADKKEIVLIHVAYVLEQTRIIMNEIIPRPCLKGVTPADVHFGKADIVRVENALWIDQEKENMARKEDDKITSNKKKWKIVKEQLSLKTKSIIQRLTLFCFFLKQPLRKMVKLIPEVLGNLQKI